jgi:hypothetical protein
MWLYNPPIKTIPYHGISKVEYANISSTAHCDEEEEVLLQEDFRARQFRSQNIYCYLVIALTGLLLGVLVGQFFRIDYEVDGYIGTSPISLVAYEY